MAARAITEDLYARAWGVVAMDWPSAFTPMPHAKLMTCIRPRVGEGSLRRLLKPSLKVSVAYHGQGAPTTVGVPPGSPLSPLSRHISLHLLDPGWPKRGYPEKVGATLHRYADDAILVGRQSAAPALQAFTALALRMDWTVHRDKRRITTRPEGFDCLGFRVVKRRSPTSGKEAIDSFPRKAAPGRVRRRIKTVTRRRAPMAPPDFVQQGNQVVRGSVQNTRSPRGCTSMQVCGGGSLAGCQDRRGVWLCSHPL
jgi:RNA-directed DNA polymerase